MVEAEPTAETRAETQAAVRFAAPMVQYSQYNIKTLRRVEASNPTLCTLLLHSNKWGESRIWTGLRIYHGYLQPHRLHLAFKDGKR